MGLLDRFLGAPKPVKFARLFIAALRKAGDNRVLEFDESQFQINIEDNGEKGIINLQNFFLEYSNAPKTDREDRLRVMVRAVLSHKKELPEEYDDASYDLRPKIWTRVTFDKLALQQKVEGGRPPDIPLMEVGSHLYATVVYDLPESVRSISSDSFEEWGVSFYEALEVAQQNLLEDNFAFASIGDRLYTSLSGDSYDSSRILLIDLIRKLEVDGDHIAMIPNRDTLLITGSDDDEGLEMMVNLAEKALENPRPMIAHAMRLDGNTWVDWKPQPTHPVYNRLRRLELNWHGVEYADQKELLEQLVEQERQDRFIASFSAVEKDDDATSYCVWSEGVLTWLPQTNVVVFFREGEDVVASAAWEDVLQIVGHRMRELDFYPPRYEVLEFPSDEELLALGNEGL